MYHVPLAVQCIYGRSNELGEDGDGKGVSELAGGWERMEDCLVSCMQMT